MRPTAIHRGENCCVAPSTRPAHSRPVSTYLCFPQDETGNLADCSGYFPGGVRYKDPIRPDASFTIMQEEAKIMAEVATDAKFDTVGQPGNL